MLHNLCTSCQLYMQQWRSIYIKDRILVDTGMERGCKLPTVHLGGMEFSETAVLGLNLAKVLCVGLALLKMNGVGNNWRSGWIILDANRVLCYALGFTFTCVSEIKCNQGS